MSEIRPYKPHNWLSEVELLELERTAKTEPQFEAPTLRVLSLSRIQSAGTSAAHMKTRGWASLQDGRAGMFRREGYDHADSDSSEPTRD